MDRTTPADLPARWRERAQQLRDYGGDAAAKVWEIAATELAQVLRSMDDETLNLTEAARASGYSADHLGQLIRRGKLKNFGRKNAPRLRRADLPSKRTTPPEPRHKPAPRPQSTENAELINKLR